MSSFQRTQTALKVDGFVGFKTELALITATGMAPPGAAGANVAAFIDQSGHPTAGDFYKTFRDEPVLPSGTVHVSKVTGLAAMTVSSLLETILDSGHESVLISCHGNPRGFFNCKSLTAPDVLDGYAPIDPGSATSSSQAWSDSRKKHPVRVDEGSAPNRFAVAQKVGNDNKLTFLAITESSQAFRNFVDRHFVVPESLKMGARVPGRVLIPPGKLVFPADRAYRKHLRKSNE